MDHVGLFFSFMVLMLCMHLMDIPSSLPTNTYIASPSSQPHDGFGTTILNVLSALKDSSTVVEDSVVEDSFLDVNSVVEDSVVDVDSFLLEEEGMKSVCFVALLLQ